MKNIKILIVTLIFSLLLASCFNNNEDEENGVSDAKDEILGENSGENTQDENDNNDGETDGENDDVVGSGGLDNSEKYEEASNTEADTQRYTVNYLTDERFLSLDSLEGQDFEGLEVELTGNTLVDSVDRIVVNFSNPESDYPDDNYTLQTFESGDSSFLYRAFSQYETLDEGVNTYLLEAYSGDTVSRLEVVINIGDEYSEEDSNNSSNSSSSIESFDLNTDNLPSSSEFGSPRENGNGIYTYSDIKGLEIKKVSEDAVELESDSVTNFLIDNGTGWFYWNTLRPISGETGVSFYVVSLDGEDYTYEKHYYLENGIYGIVPLTQGDGADQESLSDINSQLSEKNDEFEITEVTDELFTQILNQ